MSDFSYERFCKFEDNNWYFLILRIKFFILSIHNVSINVLINVLINVSIKLNNTESLILDIIKNNKNINKAQIAKMIERSEMTVQRAVKKLIDERLIKRVGSNKTGYWEVIDTNIF